MTKVLVTGGAGFIGSNLSNALHARGWHVDVVDDLSNGNAQFLHVDLRSERLWVEDFASPEVLKRISEGAYEYVFHLAANPRVTYSVEHPVETNDTNVSKTLMLLNACKTKGTVKRFVFAASSSSYGNTDILPTPETAINNPQSPYALQKAIIENYLKLFYSLYGLDSVCLRFFNVFGPNQLGTSPYSTAVSAWLTAIKSNKSMRSDGDGSQSRDMCYVDNVVDALIKSALCKEDLKAEIINVGVGEVVTNLQILNYLKSKYPKAISHNAPWRIGDVKNTKADITKAKELIGYDPRVKVWEGLDKTIKWYEDNWDWLQKMQ